MMALRPMLRGRLLQNEPLAGHTSWRVGGPADQLYVPADLADLRVFLQSLRADTPVLWLGLGSNVLVRDGGVRGTVILTSGALADLQLLREGILRAEAGVASAKVARYSVQHHFVGAEFLAGIPGTVGGALAMNAGAFGGETWRIVHAVETINRQGEIRVRTPQDFTVGYRSVQGPSDEWFVAGHFQLARGETEGGKSLIKTLLARRSATQPTQLPNAGSVFRNPPGDYAARLIEAAGLKGTCEGRACVSELHANFIVNTGGATAAQIEILVDRVRTCVAERHGVRLETEVRILGESL